MVGNRGKKLFLVLSIEGRLTHQHLVQQHSVGPPVYTLPVWLVQNDLKTYAGFQLLFSPGTTAYHERLNIIHPTDAKKIIINHKQTRKSSINIKTHTLNNTTPSEIHSAPPETPKQNPPREQCSLEFHRRSWSSYLHRCPLCTYRSRRS